MFVPVVITCFISIISLFASGAYDVQDQTSSRANTLLDDADDIQRQLDNEARDRIKYGGADTAQIVNVNGATPSVANPTAGDLVTRRTGKNCRRHKTFKFLFVGDSAKHKTIWVVNFPTGSLENEVLMVTRSVKNKKSEEYGKGILKRNTRALSTFMPELETLMKRCWTYKDQSVWSKTYPACGGRSQSPVDLPYNGLIKACGARKLTFKNYAEVPTYLMVENDGRTVSLRGKWKEDVKPFITGGAAHGRRYIFNSLTLHWPSEHSVGSLMYPMESQLLHISAEYKTMEEAIKASAKDPLAILGVVNLYRFDNYTEESLSELLKCAKCNKGPCCQLPIKPLDYFSPPFKEYACYQGSLTAPPCTEAVLWLVRARALSITRSDVEFAEKLLGPHAMMPFRVVQPLNDRKTYFFHD